MENRIDKAEFFLETEEFDKAEEMFSQIFDSNNNSLQAIKGLVICKVAQSAFEKDQIKAAMIYLDKLNELDFDTVEKESFIGKLLELLEEYFKKLNKKFRDEANELTKRPALDGQLYAVKQLSDTTDYLSFLNNNTEKFDKGFELAGKLYELSKYKDDTAYKIVSLHDVVLVSVKNTPQMTGKTLLDISAVSNLKESRKKWVDLSGEHKSKATVSPSDSGGCLILIATLSGLVGSLSVILLIFFT